MSEKRVTRQYEVELKLDGMRLSRRRGNRFRLYNERGVLPRFCQPNDGLDLYLWFSRIKRAQVASRTRCRNRSKLARPYICRLIVLRRLT